MQLHTLLSFVAAIAATGADAEANPAAAAAAAAMTTTSAPALNSGCSSLRSIAASCKSATTSFTELRGYAQASCLCSGGSGSAWDNAASACLSWAQTSHPNIAHSLIDGGAVDFCSLVAEATSDLGPLWPTLADASPTAAAFTNPACHSLENIIESCARATPSFAGLRGNVQVSCLCGEGDSGWDAAARSCYQFARTAHPAFAAALTDVHALGACAAVRTGPAAAASTGASTTGASGNGTAMATTGGSASAATTGSSAATSMPTSTASTTPSATNAAPGADLSSSLYVLWSSLGALIVGFFVLG